MNEETRKDDPNVSAVLKALKSEFEAAQRGLSQQLAQTNDRLGSLIWTLERDLDAVRAQHASDEKIEALQQCLQERERALELTREHVVELEHTVDGLHKEIAQLRSQENWLLSANRDLSERLVAIKAGEKTGDLPKAEAVAEIESLRRTLADRDARVAWLSTQLDTMQQDIEAARGAVELLSDEIVTVRAENQQLHKQLADSESALRKKARCQRIMMVGALRHDGTGQLGHILVAAGLISPDELADALQEQLNSTGRMLGEILMDRGAADEAEIAQTVACQMKLPLVQLDGESLNRDAARLAGEGVCTRFHCIPVDSTGEELVLAMANPRDALAVAEFERLTNRRVAPIVATPSDVDAAITQVYGMPMGPVST